METKPNITIPSTDEPWYKPSSPSSFSPSSPKHALGSPLSSSSSPVSSGGNVFATTVSDNTQMFLRTNGISIALMEDVRSVFNIPWHEYPFTLDFRPVQDQYTGRSIPALPLPLLIPFATNSLKDRLKDTMERAILGWVPADHFATASLFLPLERDQCHALAKDIVLPFLQAEFQQKQRRDQGRYTMDSSSSSSSSDSSPIYTFPSNLSPEALHIVTIIQLLVSGNYTPNRQPIFHYRWIPRTTASLFLSRYPFLSIGNDHILQRPGVTTNLTPGTVNTVAIARTIPQLPFCILTEEEHIIEKIMTKSPGTIKRTTQKRGALYVGSFEQASNVNVFTRLRIGAVVNVSMDKECPNAFETVSSSSSLSMTSVATNSTTKTYQRSIDMPKEIKYCRIPLADTTKSEFKNYIPTFVPFIEEHLAKGIPVLVHCHQGLSRSVTIILCYLMIQLGYPLGMAWSLFYGYTQNGRIARPNSGFQRQLIEMDEAIRKAEQEEAIRQKGSGTE